MPALSPTMEKGTLAKWLVAEGDSFQPGDLVAEIETDKATLEIEAPEAGRIVKLVIDEGTDDVAVGTVIALIAGESEDSSIQMPAKLEDPRALEPPPVPLFSSAIAAVRTASEAQIAPERVLPAMRVKASPLARRVAKAKGIDLSGITGTGPNGRIVADDLGIRPDFGRCSETPSVESSIAAGIAPPPPGVPVEVAKLSSMRKIIAQRLSKSKQSIPHFYLTARCNLDALLKLRGELNDSLGQRGVKLTVNDLLIKALALALVEVPGANVQFGGEELYRFSRVDVSMAVAIDGGLVTPIIKSADTLSLFAIATTSKLLAEKARAGALAPDEYQGGTVSISNLGMFGVDEMFPVINPPQALILGIGAAFEQPWKVSGGLGLATIMAATASFDHRAIDGAVAAEFMGVLRHHIESPLLLVA